MIDFVVVHYNEKSHRQTVELARSLNIFHSNQAHTYRFVDIDNGQVNRGFAKACNLGALITNDEHAGDIIGLLNPDVLIRGAFIEQVVEEFRADPQLMVCGERFGKPAELLDAWDVSDWVCGAAFFVRRDWFHTLGGFDEQFVWSWEETDFIRQTEQIGKRVKSISLPISHTSPDDDSDNVLFYKHYHLNRGWQLYKRKWGIEP
jgi:GT2 family glycosyltransferase